MTEQEEATFSGSELKETAMQISKDADKLLSLIGEREQQLIAAEQQSYIKASAIIENAQREAAEIICKTNENVKSAESNIKEQNEKSEKDAAAIIVKANIEAESIVADIIMKKQQMEMELKDWKKEQELIASTVTFDSVIHLNVGGHKFDTTVATMTRFPDSMLGAMFSGRHQLPKDKDGYYFIDQDGTHFRHIINFLRNPEVFENFENDKSVVELRNQAAYYLLENEMFAFQKFPPQRLLVYCGGRKVSDNVVIFIQDRDGIWNLDKKSFEYFKSVCFNYVPQQKSKSWDIQVCLSCHKGYVIFNGQSSEVYGCYIYNASALPIIKNQLQQNACRNCNQVMF